MCSDNQWITTRELREYHGVQPWLVYKHTEELVGQGLARRTFPCKGGQGSNPWLFHPDAIELLQDMRGSGRPRMEPTEEQRSILARLSRQSTKALSIALGVSWHTAKRWREEQP